MENENSKLIERLWMLFSSQEWELSKTLFHKEFIADWPQSRERFIGADAFVNMQCAYPGNHKIQILQLMPLENRVVSAVYISADTGQQAFANSYFEIKDGKIWKLIEFWGAPYEAPDWRKKFSEQY